MESEPFSCRIHDSCDTGAPITASSGSKQDCCVLGGSLYHWLERLFPCSVCSLTYNPPHCLGLKLFIERQATLLPLMDVGLPREVDLLNSAPPRSNRPALLPFSSCNAPASPYQPPLNYFGEGGPTRRVLAICPRMKQERNVVDPFSPVISFTISDLARSMRFFSEVLGSRWSQWCSLSPLCRIRSSRRPRHDGSIKPGRTSWHVDGIGRRLEGRPDGMVDPHGLGANARQVAFPTRPTLGHRVLLEFPR